MRGEWPLDKLGTSERQEIKGERIPTVLIVGSATRDTILQGTQTTRKIGGVVTYAGLTFQRHGIPTAVVSNIASRDVRIRRLFQEHGILLFSGTTPVTTRFVNINEGNSRRQEAPSLAHPIRLAPALPLLKSVRHVHLGPLHPDDLHPDCLASLSRFKGRITLDVQGYVRKIRGGRVFPAVSKYLAKALHLSRIVKAGSEEMETILAAYDMEIATFQNVFGIDEILVTSGRKGGFVRLSSGEKIGFEACSVDREIDTTGAGDVLFAAYLVKRIYHGLSVDASVQYAARVAADQVAGRFIEFVTLLL